jgi:FtsP/CotA-like multicopper oxidase with cupredoxin domain
LVRRERLSGPNVRAPWPVLPVARAKYRLRLLNASNARAVVTRDFLFQNDAGRIGWKISGQPYDPAQFAEIVVRFTDYAGRFVFHCHNLEHEDMAMMADFVTE